jgi:serralysin
VLYGGTGTDQLFGGDDGDYLWGEAGNDTLTGGAGADRFAFSAGSGFDLITDFRRGQDKIVLKGLAGADDFSDLTITTDAHGWAVISWGDAASSITLTGVAAAQLTASDVWFTG